MNLSEAKLKVQEKLQKAIELELSTIPPYLTAVFSIKPGTNKEAAAVIRSVFMEEMLHLLLAANVLSATGGCVQLGEANIPHYPYRLNFEGKTFKHREFDINLAALTPENVATFMRIELPDGWDDVAALLKVDIDGYTIGEFYRGIQEDLVALCACFGEEAIFSGNAANQISEEYYWSGGGRPIVVTSLADALKAIDVVIDQGEGADGTLQDGDHAYFEQPQEVPHYFRFNEVFVGRCYAAHDKPHDPPSGKPLPVDYESVYPLKPNCTKEDYENQPIVNGLNTEFNLNYSRMLLQLEEGFRGNPAVFYTAIMNGMHNLTPLARNIVQIPLEGDAEGRHAAPTFEWVSPELVGNLALAI